VKDRFLSRKWILAVSSLAVVTLFSGFGLYKLAKDAGDVALIIGAWAGSDTTILGLYGTVNYLQKKASDGANG
jgi:hypothetical protein